MSDVLESPETAQEAEAIPTIYANGTDDDSVGFAAALRDEKVMFDGRVYRPGADINITGKRMYFGVGVLLVDRDGEPLLCFGPPESAIRVVELVSSREVYITDCRIRHDGDLAFVDPTLAAGTITNT